MYIYVCVYITIILLNIKVTNLSVDPFHLPILVLYAVLVLRGHTTQILKIVYSAVVLPDVYGSHHVPQI